MTPKTFHQRLAEQADRYQDARTALTAMYEREMDRHLSREGELRGAALAVPPHEPDGCLDCLRVERGGVK